MKKVLCIITAVLAWLQISANERPLSFKHINHEDGLSSVSITDIYPDKNGIIWIGTYTGLDCIEETVIISGPHSDSIFRNRESISLCRQF